VAIVADDKGDPVRLYLRQVRSVNLLSREGEVAIAKRIETGRRAMISGLCESPLTFRAIFVRGHELNDGRILLRDLIKVDATCIQTGAEASPTAISDAASAMAALATMSSLAKAGSLAILTSTPPSGSKPNCSEADEDPGRHDSADHDTEKRDVVRRDRSRTQARSARNN
jgi:RNA polymerase primary sigma factor